MADDGLKSISFIKYLRKFSGRTAEYSEWKYHTRRTIGLYKPDICKLLSGTCSKPTEEYGYHERDSSASHDDHDRGHDDNEYEDGQDVQDENPAEEQLRQDIQDAKAKAETAAEDYEEAKKSLEEATRQRGGTTVDQQGKRRHRTKPYNTRI